MNPFAVGFWLWVRPHARVFKRRTAASRMHAVPTVPSGGWMISPESSDRQPQRRRRTSRSRLRGWSKDVYVPDALYTLDVL